MLRSCFHWFILMYVRLVIDWYYFLEIELKIIH